MKISPVRTKILGIISITALVTGGAVYALNPFSQEPTPVPYTPPAVTIPAPTPPPTEPQIPTEKPDSLDDLIPPDGPLSIADIEKYTRNAYVVAYNDGIDDFKKFEKAHYCLEKVVYSVVDTIFEDEEGAVDELVATLETRDSYLYGGLRSSVNYKDWASKEVEMASEEGKKGYSIALFNMFSKDLVTAEGTKKR